MDIQRIRGDTPCNNVYMNHASTSVPPISVIEAANRYYDIVMQYGATSKEAERLTEIETDKAGRRIADLINANETEISFMPNGSVGISMIALGFPWKKGQNIIVDEMSFISSVSPFLKVRDLYGVEIRYLPGKLPGIVDCERLESLIDKDTALVVLTHSANSLGVIQPAECVGKITREKKVRFLLDASETVGVAEVDVKKINCDYLAATGRKYIRGPSGIGFLYVKHEVQNELKGCIPAWNSGIWDWNAEQFFYYEDKRKWNYGEKNYPGIFGLSEAARYLSEVGGQIRIKKRVDQLMEMLIGELQQIAGVSIVGPKDAGNRAGVIGFQMKDKSPASVAQYLNENNVGMMGHHFFCPGIQKLFQIEGVARLSLHYWNTEEEIEYVTELLKKL